MAFEYNSETMDADLKKIESDCIVSKPGVLKKYSVNKWNEAVDKIHLLNIEIYNNQTV